MIFVPFSDGCRSVISFTLNGKELSIIEDWGRPAPSAQDYQDLADEILDAYTVNMLANQVNTFALTGVEVYDMSSPFAPVYSAVPLTPEPGLIAQDSLPNQSVILVSKRTNNRGRTSRGRTNLRGWGEGAATAALWRQAHLDAVMSSYLNMVNQIEISGWTHVVASLTYLGQPRTFAELQPITAYSTSTIIRSLRTSTAGT